MTAAAQGTTSGGHVRLSTRWLVTAAPWLGAAIAASAAFLAAGAVSPLAGGGTARVGFLPASPGTFVSAALAAAAGWWVCRRRACALVWVAAGSLMPWVPMPAVPAVLLWHGGAALVLLATAAFTALLPVFAPAARTVLSRSPREQLIIALVAAAIAYGFAAWRMQPQLPGGDEPHYLVITQSLLADGDLRIENNHQRGDYRAYISQELEPDYLRRGLDGQIYSIHAPGTSALVLPAFALAGYPGVVAFLAMFAAAGAGLAWLAAYRLTDDAGAAWAGWATVALSAPFFFQGFTVFPDGPGAVLAMTGVYALVVPARLQRLASCAVHGVALAALPWLHTRYAVIACILGVLLGTRIVEARERRLTRLVAFVAVPAVSAAVWFGFFHVIYGTFNPAAPYGGYIQSAWSNIPRGLSGLLLDQQFGILPNAPAYLVAIAGASSLWHIRRRLAIEIGVLIVPYAALTSAYHMWWGGRSSAARFLVPVLLPLALPAAARWWTAGARGRAFAGAALAASATLSLGLAWVDRGALVYNVRDGYALWLEAIAPLVRLPLALPSVFRGSLGETWMMAAIWAGALALAVRQVVPSPVARDGQDGARASTLAPVVALSLVGAVTLSASVAWWATGADVIDEGTGERRVLAALLERPGRGWHSALPVSASRVEIAKSLRLASSHRRVDASTDAWSGAGLPPGRYRVLTSSTAAVSSRARVLVGRGQAVAVDAPVDRPLGDPELFAFDLPAGADRLRVTLDEQGRRVAGRLVLQLAAPIQLPGRPEGRYARAVMPYAARCWFVDGNAFPESSGFWVRGRSETAIVIDRGARRRELSVAAGAVATTATVAFGTSRADEFPLAAGERRIVALPGTGVLIVRIASRAGFRPSEHDPASKDARWLGVFVEVR